MYETFFGMTRRPFSATPDPNCFVATDSVQEALDGLSVCAESGQGIGILTGPAGTGKTLLCEKLVSELGAQFETVFIGNSNFETPRSLLQGILYELGHPYSRMSEQELRLELQTAVKKIRSTTRGLILVIDEAHLLSEELLEEVRSVTNLIDDGEPLIRVILSGQSILEENLTSPTLQALNQRVRSQVYLEPLTRDESIEYIARRLEWVGSDIEGIFSEDAIHFVVHASDGIARCLNQLCDHSLLLAYVAGQQPVDIKTVREALEDLKQLPLHWNEPLDHSESQLQDEEPESVNRSVAVEDAIEQTLTELESEFASIHDAEMPADDFVNEDMINGESAVNDSDHSDPPIEEPVSASDYSDGEDSEMVAIEFGAGIDSEESNPISHPTGEDSAMNQNLIAEHHEIPREPVIEHVEAAVIKDVDELMSEVRELSGAQPEISRADPSAADVVEPSGGALQAESRVAHRTESAITAGSIASTADQESDGHSFEEEVVVDRYAALDDGRVDQDGLGIVWQIPGHNNSATESTERSDAQIKRGEELHVHGGPSGHDATDHDASGHDASGHDAYGEVVDAPSPVQIIDEIMPLLDESSVEWHSIETSSGQTSDDAPIANGDIEDSAVFETSVNLPPTEAPPMIDAEEPRLVVRNSADDSVRQPQSEARIAVESQLAAAIFDGIDAELEDEIGADVIAIRQETHRATVDRLPGDLSRSAESISADGRLRTTLDGVANTPRPKFPEGLAASRSAQSEIAEFDVVEPEPDSPVAPEETLQQQAGEIEPLPPLAQPRSDAAQSQVRPYGRLFSELRRRQQQP